MIDMDPRLDTKLRSLFEDIDAQYAPSSVTNFEAPARNLRRRANVLVAAIGATVVAVAIVIFGLEIGGHPSSTVPAPAGQASLPTPPQLESVIPKGWHVVFPTLHGRGSTTLPMFIANGSVAMAFECAGDGDIQVGLANGPGTGGQPCNPEYGVVTFSVSLISGNSVRIVVTAKASTHWVMLVAESGVPVTTPTNLPKLGQDLPPGSTVLVPATYGSGTQKDFQFTPTERYYIDFACNGVGPFDIDLNGGPGHIGLADCGASGMLNEFTYMAPDEHAGKHTVITVTVSVTAPSSTWEILVYENPSVLPTPSSTFTPVPTVSPTGG